MELHSCLVALLLLAAAAADPADEILGLPGLSFTPNFKHYSGYLNASETRFLHYWFVESQGNPSTDPLVFWFNGGPGCSSLEGLLAEHGPYFLNNDTSTLRKNEYAWNKLANVVYIESPAGVGFSYATDADSGVTTDDTTSAESYRAIKHFLGKFPPFRNHSVFLAQALPKEMLHLNDYDIYRHCDVPLSSRRLQAPYQKASEKAYVNDANLCNPHFDPYLNKPEVRKALHIPDHVGTWRECAPRRELNYTWLYDDMSPQITKILDHEVRVLLYYGDTDTVCNFVGGQRFAASLGLKRTGTRQPWSFDDFLAGFKTEYDKNLTYITVGGVGHMVPQWQPKGALYFFGQFLKNEPI